MDGRRKPCRSHHRLWHGCVSAEGHEPVLSDPITPHRHTCSRLSGSHGAQKLARHRSYQSTCRPLNLAWRQVTEILCATFSGYQGTRLRSLLVDRRVTRVSTGCRCVMRNGQIEHSGHFIPCHSVSTRCFACAICSDEDGPPAPYQPSCWARVTHLQNVLHSAAILQ